MKNRSLDELLQDWDRRSQADPQAVERIQSRVAYQIRQKHDRVGDLAEEAVSVAPWARLVYGALALLAILAGGTLFAWRHSQPRMTPSKPAVDFVHFTDPQIAARAVVMEEMQALFDDHLRWVLIDDHGMRFGLSSEAPSAISPDSWLVVRTVFAVREDGHRDWTPVWTADTLLRMEEHVSADFRNGESVDLHLWAHRLPGGAYFVESQFQTASWEELRAHESWVFTAGEAAQIRSGRTGEGEYRLYQAVHPFSGAEG